MFTTLTPALSRRERVYVVSLATGYSKLATFLSVYTGVQPLVSMK